MQPITPCSFIGFKPFLTDRTIALLQGQGRIQKISKGGLFQIGGPTCVGPPPTKLFSPDFAHFIISTPFRFCTQMTEK